ncbi:M20/M25/M40 family metallo-hydrolase [Umezawaea beigongshangensis]|uniref:M20/M25/M40 family metallo-hydrolase n=1 Tax=Umezawaea beigongshangensis TaxID=2780383 RepID=UPI0018F1CC09|nr:M20/M25/M40 family metallo-hydrolase [Umezawaea beigongshangensis]
MTTVHSEEEVCERVRESMPSLWATLDHLVRFRSVSAQNPETLRATADDVVRLLHEAGVPSAQVITVEHDGHRSAPLVHAHEAGTGDGPTVLLYAHYDVQPADAARWTKIEDPFAPASLTEPDGVRMYGRGTADDKAGIVMHLGAVRSLGGAAGLPFTLKIVVEGEEETGRSALDSHLAAHPDDERFTADLVVVADTGNVRLGVPTLTSTLRGIAVVDVTLRTLKQEIHSGMYGGPTPDAFMALTQVLATMLDPDDGSVTVPGLTEYDGTWPTVDEEEFRAAAGVLGSGAERPRLLGTGTLASRLYGKPSINVVGLSGVPGMDQPVNALRSEVTARISVRIAPDQDPQKALQALSEHIRRATPWNVEAQIEPVGEGSGFTAIPGQHAGIVEHALLRSHGATEVQRAGQGGSIPLVAAFRRANPQADIVLWGCEEPRANIHGHDESVDRAELERLTTAEALLLHALRTPARS